MKRLLFAMMLVALGAAIAACTSAATPDPVEIARIVGDTVRATVDAMPRPQPEIVEKVVRETVIVEKIVHETVIVEKLIEVTVMVEREVVVTPTPLPPTPIPEVPVQEVKPLDARASRFVSGNASPALPDGEPGQVSIIVMGEIGGQSYVPLILRNNTGDTITRIGLFAVARTSDGEMFAVGEGDADQPHVVAPGEITFGHLLFGNAELSSSMHLDIEVTYDLVKEGGRAVNRDLEIEEFQFLESHLVGVLRNPYDTVVSEFIEVYVHCFTEQGTLLDGRGTHTEKDEIEPHGTIPFQVDMYGGRASCPVFLITAEG